VFHDRADLAALAAKAPADVLVAIPEVLPLLMPLHARARVIWTGNAFPGGDCALSIPWRPPFATETEERRLGSLALLGPVVDRIVVGSEWHARRLREQVPLRDGVVRVAYLGVPLQYYRGSGLQRHRHRLVYTSQARRGLELLLEIFPRIRAAVPTAELWIFGYEYDSEGPPAGQAVNSLTGVRWMGRVSKSRLARELSSASIFAYPTQFRETFSLSVAEAQAAGLPVVTSDLAALAERVHDGVDGFLIGGKAKNPGYADAFVERVVRLLVDDDTWERCSTAALRHAHRAYDWESIAANWEADLQTLVAGRDPTYPDPSVAVGLVKEVCEVATVHPDIPPGIALQALKLTWSSYGFDPASLDAEPAAPRARLTGRTI
jgi:glycosyltransferase involved in cell wall biosynthesis